MFMPYYYRRIVGVQPFLFQNVRKIASKIPQKITLFEFAFAFMLNFVFSKFVDFAKEL